jgi:hypothetical protein
MSKTVEKSALYEMVYSGGSNVMHSSSYDYHVSFGGGAVTFQPIRCIEGFSNVFQFTMILGLFTFRKILERYREDELPNFSRKYSEKFQQAFLSFPKITVKAEITRI